MSSTIDQSDKPSSGLRTKRLAQTMAAIAGLSSALSVVVGLLASRVAPHGLQRLAVTLHLAREPFIVKLAAGMAAIAVAAATVSGLLHFYTWWRERNADRRTR
jgi:Zn-dependent protease with chaperone function